MIHTYIHTYISYSPSPHEPPPPPFPLPSLFFSLACAVCSRSHYAALNTRKHDDALVIF